LYPSPSGRQLDVRQVDGQYEKFTMVEKTIKQNLAHLVTTAPKLLQPTESMLAGSIAMALCYINRLDRTKPHGSRLNARILVLTGSDECASQYMTYMNVFFTAQKHNIVLDVCALDKSMTLLQQGCDITGGQYLRLEQLEGLLQYLLVCLFGFVVAHREMGVKNVCSPRIFTSNIRLFLRSPLLVFIVNFFQLISITFLVGLSSGSTNTNKTRFAAKSKG
jgi:transcription factor TFB4